ncbi:uncharacterized protein MYCGRDRAFT_109011 [Zymoseptoria tritici IPO323]|uniref:Uncharacterized protein n=1 Tax=Zymoseptoria tritici (strain CBS 115943 / IPO323) TaxID=336722 RepID=F9X9G4_ZYMTI|nr:uncharacterized protein MYCGRDRAFT_109011 [Zymoseptoria tritici IPO323]EGP87873.1 hypothetical protein MYCGRDRAFT_109011 [Zymoseptoria tritici IPO323]
MATPLTYLPSFLTPATRSDIVDAYAWKSYYLSRAHLLPATTIQEPHVVSGEDEDNWLDRERATTRLAEQIEAYLIGLATEGAVPVEHSPEVIEPIWTTRSPVREETLVERAQRLRREEVENRNGREEKKGEKNERTSWPTRPDEGPNGGGRLQRHHFEMDWVKDGEMFFARGMQSTSNPGVATAQTVHWPVLPKTSPPPIQLVPRNPYSTFDSTLEARNLIGEHTARKMQAERDQQQLEATMPHQEAKERARREFEEAQDQADMGFQLDYGLALQEWEKAHPAWSMGKGKGRAATVEDEDEEL